MKKTLLFLIAFVCYVSLSAQQPFKDYNYDVKIATLSNGKYVEHFDQDTLIQIGSVILNRLNGKVLYFVEYDTVYNESDLKPELISRWTSPDPLVDEFYSESPYNFVHNDPIRYTDPDGRAPEDGPGPGDPKPKTINDLNPLERVALAVTLVMDKIGSILNERNGVENPSTSQNVVAATNMVNDVVMSTVAHNEIMQSSSSSSTSKTINAVEETASQTKTVVREATTVSEQSAVKVTTSYSRPTNATTVAQRQAVQGQSCATCGATGQKMFADHKVPLVKEFYQTGKIDTKNMRSVQAVQPQCQSCSGKQGAELKKYSQEQKAANGLN